ncbi:hypothetical protein BpHYR1_014374 [Brachionus plicatilis]|uniref:Uncharacterized protein n=1 Tax=Brachionus plicatilis TaxID=10195 RepID=A0A3M7RL84_BRAPC|nr:hypothetical protein BpHYR1_014374 [Brachionus plicatilis]
MNSVRKNPIVETQKLKSYNRNRDLTSNYGMFIVEIAKKSKAQLILLKTGVEYKPKPKYVIIDERIREIIKKYSLENFNTFYKTFSYCYEKLKITKLIINNKQKAKKNFQLYTVLN